MANHSEYPQQFSHFRYVQIKQPTYNIINITIFIFIIITVL